MCLLGWPPRGHSPNVSDFQNLTETESFWLSASDTFPQAAYDYFLLIEIKHAVGHVENWVSELSAGE